jgi:S1-C subfamily serine protease
MSTQRIRLPRLGRVLATVAAAALLLVPAAGSARADDPAQAAKTIALASPGVVFVGIAADVAVQVSDPLLIQSLGGRKAKFRTSTVQSGSGMVVNPKGVIVTASHLLEFDDSQQKDLRVYAANELFFNSLQQIFGGFASGESPWDRYRLSNPDDNRLLHGCYDETVCQFTFKPVVSVVTARQVAGASTARSLPAQVKLSTGSDVTDVAVLQVDATDLPTVLLALTSGDLQSGQSVIGLGFPGSATTILKTGVTEPTSLFGRVSSVRSTGSTEVVQVDMNVEGGVSGGATLDDQGRVIGLLSFTGEEGGARTQVYLRTADDIRSALRSAGFQATRGEVDTVFAQAMTSFWGHHYSAAIPLFQKALNLYDGHPVAKKYLAQAQAKAGGTEDVPLPAPGASSKGGSGLDPKLLGVLAAIVVVVLAVGGGMLLRGRRAARGPTAAAPGPEAPVPDLAEAQPRYGPEADDQAEADPAGLVDLAEVEPLDPAPPADNGRRFCPHCGARVAAASSRFCDSCGQRLQEVTRAGG